MHPCAHANRRLGPARHTFNAPIRLTFQPQLVPDSNLYHCTDSLSLVSKDCCRCPHRTRVHLWISVPNRAAWHLGEKCEGRPATALLTPAHCLLQSLPKKHNLPISPHTAWAFFFPLWELPSSLTCPPWTCTVNIYSDAIFSILHCTKHLSSLCNTHLHSMSQWSFIRSLLFIMCSFYSIHSFLS